MKKYSRVRADIDLDAVAHNFEVMRGRLKKGTDICAVVKADCYGHGALQIARMIEPYDYIWGYACATPEEAMLLKKNGLKKPVILLGYAFPESYETIIQNDIRACVFEEESAAALSEAAQKLGRKAIVHLAVDTGMSRIGFQANEEAAKEILRIASLPGLVIEGMFTHFARADEESLEPAVRQYQAYTYMADLLEKNGLTIPVRHVSNSAALMRFPEANENMVRAGITIYGLLPSEEVREEMKDLKPAMSLISHISYVKCLPAGRAVSYGGTYVTTHDTVVATIPVGYADGYPRGLSNKGSVLIRGRKVPIIGRVCMDQFMVDVSSMPDVRAGEEVVLMGRQGDAFISAEELGSLSGRFNYELVSDITKRVPRCYIQNGAVVEQVDYF